MFEAFKTAFGSPRPNTGMELSDLDILHSASLNKFVSEVGGGVYANGLISIASVREDVASVGGWRAYLPTNVRIFACSAFGTIFATTGDDAWIVSTQYGEILQAEMSLEDVIVTLASTETRVEILQEGLFESWQNAQGALADRAVLCPTPAIPLGGTWSVAGLSQMSLSVYLPFSADLFDDATGSKIHVIRPEP